MNNDGSAVGQRSFRNAWASVAPYERSRSVASREAWAKPSSSATTTGKNVTRTTTRILGSTPNPNHSRNSGAIAITGIVWDVTRIGSTERRIAGSRSIATADAI